MPNVVRFTLSTARNLDVPGAGSFVSGVLDVDANNIAHVARVRYLVQPYRAVEVGIVDSATPPPSLPAVPASPIPDPYPQYVTDADLSNPLSGPSAVLRAAYGRRSVLHDDYDGKPDGIPAAADSGQAWYQYPASGTSAMRVVGGKLTVSATTGGAAGYQQCDLGIGNPVRRIGVRGLTFTPYTTSGGSFALVAWKTLNTGVAVPDSNFHLTVSPTQWILGVWAGNAFTQLADGTFATPLTADGVTEYTVDAVIRGNTTHILLPDRSIATVTDTRIGATPGTIACFETFVTNAATDPKSRVRGVWAESALAAEDGPASVQRLLPALAPLIPFGGIAQPRTAYWQPVGDSSVPIPGGNSNVHTDLQVDFVVGASGGAVVELSGYLNSGATTDVYWGIQIGATGYGVALAANQLAPGGPYPRSVRFVVPPGTWTPGATVTIDWTHFATVTNAGTLFLAASSLGRHASMTVSPLTA